MHFMIETKVRRFLAHCGFDVRRNASAWPLDLTGRLDIDPIDAIYMSSGRGALMKVPMARCLHLEWFAFPCDKHSASPFVQTLLAYARGSCTAYAASPLEKYYACCQPESAAEVMGAEVPPGTALAESPPAGAPKFWQQSAPGDKALERINALNVENREHGVAFGYADGDYLYGPVSDRKGQLEFERLRRTYDAIIRDGFKVDKMGMNNIRVVCLYSAEDGAWRCLVHPQGNHRIAVLAALGHSHVVIQISRAGLGGMVCREDARHWPVVKNGTLTERDARAVFDRLMSAEPPPVAQPWMAYCANLRSSLCV